MLLLLCASSDTIYGKPTKRNQCCGLTKKGKQCSLNTSTPDENGWTTLEDKIFCPAHKK
jgi:hypothetical protein